MAAASASYQNSLVEGQSTATADEEVNAGLRRVCNQSRYFADNGDSINATQWRIGNNSYEPQNIDEQFNTLYISILIRANVVAVAGVSNARNYQITDVTICLPYSMN